MNESKENQRAPRVPTEGRSGPTRGPKSGARFMTAIRVADGSHFYTLIIILVQPKVHHITTGCHTEQDLIINTPSSEHFIDRLTPDFHQTTSELRQRLAAIFFFLM